MAKEIEDDELDTGADKGDKPQSVRESIMAAREEVAEKEDDRAVDKDTARSTDKHERPAPRKRDDKENNKTLGKDSKNDESDDGKQTSKSEESETSETDTESSDEQTEEKPAVKTATTKPPVGWTKEAKAKWAELPPEIQESVLKREDEVSKGFAGTKQATERLNRLDAVINPRLQQIQAFGVTPEQTIDRLFQWMEALSHQNDGVRQQAFKTLAENFRVNLSAFAPQQQTNDQNSQQQTTQQTTQTQVDQNPPQWAQSLIERQQQIDREIATQKQSSTDQFLTSWAKDKPHYETVKAEMFGLLQSGLQTGNIVAPNGQITHEILDQVYNKAIRTNDEVWDSIQEEKQEAEAEKARVAAAKKTADAAKARKAGVGMKTTAPTLSNLNGAKSKNNSSKAMSVRDSILAAQREINEG